MFKKGDVVWAKKDFLDRNETQESTIGIVLEYYPENDYLLLGVLNPDKYAIPPRMSCCGCFYELVKEDHHT